MIFVFSLLFFFVVDGYQACHLDGYVPLAPSLRQIAEGEVFVDWIATASQKVDITEYELKHWEKDAQKGKLSIAIEDLYNNFLYLSVEPWTVYSYQLMVKTSACSKWFPSKIAHFQTNEYRGVYIYVEEKKEKMVKKKKVVKEFQPSSVVGVVSIACAAIGAIFFIALVVLFLIYYIKAYCCCTRKEEIDEQKQEQESGEEEEISDKIQVLENDEGAEVDPNIENIGNKFSE